MAASTNLLIRLRADGKQAINELGRVDAGMDKLRRGVGRAATAGAVALAGLAASSVKEFASFERGMNEVFTLLPDLSGEAMGQVSEQVKDLSSDMGVLTTDVVPALYQSISAGVPEANVFGFLETATQLSIAGVTDLETAVDGLTTITNAYGVENVTAQEAADGLFTAMKLGKTTVGEMSSSLFQVIPVAAALGVNMDEVGAALAAITSVSTPTRVAATQLRQTIVELGKAGSFAFDVFKDATGETFPAFLRGGGTLQEALQVLAGVAQDSGGSITDMFGSVEAGMAALSLTSGTGAAKFADNLDAMVEKTGAVAEGAEIMEQGLARTWDRVNALMQVAQINMGKALAPIVEDFLDAFGDKIPGAAETLGEVFTDIVGFIERAFSGFGVVKDIVDGIPGPARDAAAAIGAIGAALILASSNPVIAGLAAVAAILASIGGNAVAAQTFSEGFLAELESGTGTASGFRRVLEEMWGEDFPKLVAILDDAGVTVTGFSTALLGGAETADDLRVAFQNAVRDGKLSNAELSILIETIDALAPAALDAQSAFDRLMQTEGFTAGGTDILTAAWNNFMIVVGDTQAVADAQDALDGFNTASVVEEVRAAIGVFNELPEAVEVSLDEAKALFNANLLASQQWADTLATLTSTGMTEVAKEFEQIPEAQRAAFSKLVEENPSQIAIWEATLRSNIDGADTDILIGLSFADVPPFPPLPTPNPISVPFTFFPTNSLPRGLTRRALGGPLASGEVSLVGERGPELFVPSAAGTVIPNNQIRRGGEQALKTVRQPVGGQTINITLEGFIGTRDQLTEAVREALVQAGSSGDTGILL